MASTITLKSAAYDGRYMQLTCTQRKDDEKSYIDWTLSSVGGTSTYYSTGPTTVTINGTQVYYKARVNWDDKVFPATKGSRSNTIEVEHDAEGNKTITVSLSTVVYQNAKYVKTYSENWTLDPIQRGARFTETPPSFSNTIPPTIKYTNPLGSKATKVEVCIADSTGYYAYVPYKDLGLSESGECTFSKDDMTLLNEKVAKDKTELKVMFVIRTTTADGKQYAEGKPSVHFLVETEDTLPSVSLSLSPDNPTNIPSSLTSEYIQGKTRVKATVTAKGKYGADITAYGYRLEGKPEWFDLNTFTTNAITSSGNVEVIGVANDSREFQGTVSQTIPVLAYSKPLVIPRDGDTAIRCYRCDEKEDKPKGNSERVRIKAKRFCYDLGKRNRCALEWRCKESAEAWNDNDHPWEDLILKTTTSTDEFNALIDGKTFEKNKSYSVQIKAIDDFNEFDIKDFEIPTQDIALHLADFSRKGGKNVTVGDYCDYTEDETFRSAWKAKFDNGVYGDTFGTHNGNVYGTMTQKPALGDMLAFAEGCPDGFTPFYTGGSTTNVPATGNYLYASGFVCKRSDTQITVVIFSYYSGDLAINTYYDTAGGWLGWRYLHTTTT